MLIIGVNLSKNFSFDGLRQLLLTQFSKKSFLRKCQEIVVLPYFRNISDQQRVYFFFLAWKNYFHFDKFRFSILQIFQIDFPFFLFHFHYLQWSKAHISKASFMWIEPTVSAIPTVLYVPSLPLWPLPPTILSNKYKPRFMCKIYCVQHSLLLEEERTRAFTMGGKENWKQKLFGVSFIYLSSAKIEDRFDYLILLVQFLKKIVESTVVQSNLFVRNIF